MIQGVKEGINIITDPCDKSWMGNSPRDQLYFCDNYFFNVHLYLLINEVYTY